MPKKIILKEDGLNGAVAPSGFKFLGLGESGLSLKTGGTVSGLGGGGDVVEDIIYSNLLTKINNEELTPGQKYRFAYTSYNPIYGYDALEQGLRGNYTSQDYTDFETLYEFEFNPFEIYESDEEMLIVEALDNKSLKPLVFSEKYPADIIEFTTEINAIGTGIYFYNGNELTLPTPTTISDFDLQWNGTNMYFDLPSGYAIEEGSSAYIDFYLDDDSLGWEYLSQAFVTVKLNQDIVADFGDFQYNEGYGQPITIRITNGGTRVVLVDLTDNITGLYSADSLSFVTEYKLVNTTGFITRRTDTQKNIKCSFDFRNQKWRRFELTVEDFEVYKGTGSSVGTIFYGLATLPGGGGTGESTIFYDFQNNSGNNLTGEWADLNMFIDYERCKDIDIEYSQLPFGFSNIVTYPFNDNNVVWSLRQLKSEYYFANNTIEWASSNHFIGLFFGNVVVQGDYGMLGNTIGYPPFTSGIYDCFLKEFGNNKIDGIAECKLSFFAENIIVNLRGVNFNQAYRNKISFMQVGSGGITIGDNFQNNTILSAQGDITIGDNFRDNTITFAQGLITIGNNFQNNTVPSMLDNITIGNNFQNNTITGALARMEIGDNFQNNTINCSLARHSLNFETDPIGDNFRNNKILFTDEVDGNSISFTASTHVYGDYNCTLFKNSNGDLRLKYYDGNDDVVITAIND